MHARAHEIIEAAYRDVACNPDNAFQAFVDQFDKVVAAAFAAPQRAVLPRLDDREFATLSSPSLAARRRWLTRRIVELSYRFLFSTLLGRAKPETRETVQVWLKFVLHPLRLVWAQLKS